VLCSKSRCPKHSSVPPVIPALTNAIFTATRNPVGASATEDRLFGSGLAWSVVYPVFLSVICEPALLLLDEPFGALDPGLTVDMHTLILELWSANRMAIFMITHDLQEAFRLGTRLIVLDKVRHDPQAPDAYGSRVTYDIRLKRAGAMRASALALAG
jgi:hypothetical protein